MQYKTKDVGAFFAVRITAVDFSGEAFDGNPFDLGEELIESNRLWLQNRLTALLKSGNLAVNRQFPEQGYAVFRFFDSFGHEHNLFPGDRIVFVEEKYLYFGKACFEYLFEQVA